MTESSEAKAELSRSQVPAPTRDKDEICDLTNKTASSYSQVERVLEQLVSRVSRIEDICLRFEENMLKPIHRMEARLQRVEQQVESLAKNSRCPRSPSCPRVESDPSSLSNDAKDSQRCGASETETTGFGSNEAYKPPEPEDTSVAVGTQFHPCLIVTAPEFSSCDEEEDVNDLEPMNSKEKPKKTVSIDDALAAALAGFSSFTIAEHLKDNGTLTTLPPESLQEECLKCNQAAIATTLGPNNNDETYRFSESPKGAESDEASDFSESLKVTAPEFMGKENGDDYRVVSPSYENERLAVTQESSATGVLECPRDSTSTASGEEAIGCAGNSNCPPAHENDTCESGAQHVEKMSNFDKADILKHFPSNTSDTAELASSVNTRDVNVGSESTVDYETPILEVEFASSDNHSLKSPLEALLSNIDDPAVEGTDERVVITPEEKTTTINNLLVELDGDHVGGFVVAEQVPQDLPPVHQETFMSLI